jgi:hypothetical protein
MRRSGMMHPKPPSVDGVDPITHATERLAEAGPFGVLITPRHGDAALARQFA